MELMLPNYKVVEINAPKTFHLAKVLQDGLINYEPITLSTALAIAEKSNDIFIDIGANIGVYSLVVSSLRKCCYAYEPFPAAADVLQQTVDRYNLPINVNIKAVSKKVGKLTLYLSDKSDMSNSLNPNYRNHVGEIEVDVTTIDQITTTVKPSLIKIDAETAEKDILLGARNTIIRDRPYILLEVLRDSLGEFTIDYFKDLDYSIYKLGESEFQGKLVDIESEDNEDLRNWLISPKPLDYSFYQRVNYWLEMLVKIS